MNSMTYLDPRKTVWPGLATAIGLGLMLQSAGHPPAIIITAVVAWLCMAWWIFEPIPIPVTSLLPLAIFPLTGVLTPEQVGASVGSPLIILLMGGFLLSRGMESSGAHHRVALTVVNLVGGHRPHRLVLGFMLAGALLSMWISNTASALMLMPVALAVLASCSDRSTLAAPLLLGLAWSCSIGGLGTPIGTPPNLIFVQVFEETTGQTISFGQWMSWGVPVVGLLLPLAWWWVTRTLPRELNITLPAVGPWRSAEQRVLIIFGLTALAWITRAEPFGGWQHWLGLASANDASVALLAVVALFIVRDRRGRSAHRLATSESDSLGRAAFVWRRHLPGQGIRGIWPERSSGRRTDNGGDVTCFYHDAFAGTGGDISDRGDIEYRDHRAVTARFGGRGASGKH